MWEDEVRSTRRDPQGNTDSVRVIRRSRQRDTRGVRRRGWRRCEVGIRAAGGGTKAQKEIRRMARAKEMSS